MQTFYHFTSKENLISILTDAAFKTSYAIETILGEDEEREFGVPMVSFCNLYPSELKLAMCPYGKFGIGVAREWACHYEIKKVHYYNKQSVVNYLNLIDKFFEIVKSRGTLSMHNAYNQEHNKLRYIKNDQGERWHCGNKIPYDFTIENEWRFVPSMKTIHPFMPVEKHDINCQKASWYNKYANEIKLLFQPDDVECVIVENESDIDDLIGCLQSITKKTKGSCWDILSKRIHTYADLS